MIEPAQFKPVAFNRAARRLCTISAAAALALLTTSCSRNQTQSPQPRPAPAATTSAIPRIASDANAADLGIGNTVANLRVTTLAGASLSLDDLLRDRRALVIAMASAECPLAIEYAPRLASIEREFDGQVAFLHINAVDGESDDAIRTMIADAALRGTYARDTNASLRLELKPRTTTEVYILTPARQVLYRGAIDDQYRLGGKAARAQREYLRDALRAVIAGEKPSPAATSAPGCLIDMPRTPGQRARADAAPGIAFYPRIADILERNCVECHQPGGTAPFSLASPASVDGRAAMIAAVVREGIMPPNHGLSWTGSVPLVRDRTMSREDRELLLAWLESDRNVASAPENPTPTTPGRAANTTRPMGRDNAWLIGPPDFMLITPGPTLQPEDVPTTQRYFISINLEEDAWVEAIECRPVMRDSVAVAQIWLVLPGEPLPALNQFPASDQLFATFSRSDRLVSYAPGSARRLPAHCVLVVDLQGRAMVPVQPSQLRVAMRFAQTPPTREIRTSLIHPTSLQVRDNNPHATVEASTQLPHNARLIALRPLMGPRVQSLRVWTDQPTPSNMQSSTPGNTELIDLHRYDWRWLIRYPLTQPFVMQRNARITAQWTLNNSESNPVNPDPSAAITLGIGDAREQLGVAIEYELPLPPAAR